MKIKFEFPSFSKIRVGKKDGKLDKATAQSLNFFKGLDASALFFILFFVIIPIGIIFIGVNAINTSFDNVNPYYNATQDTNVLTGSKIVLTFGFIIVTVIVVINLIRRFMYMSDLI